MAGRPGRRYRHPHRGTIAVEPRGGGRPVDRPERGRRVATRRPARPRTPLRPAVVSGYLPRFPRSRPSREPHATRNRQVWPISPGCWRPVDCRWESSARRPRRRAASMRSRTCWRWRAAVREAAAPHGMQVTVATRLAVRVWQLVDRTIRSTRAQVRVPNESTAVTQWHARSPSSARRRSRSAGRHTPQSGVGCSRTSPASRHWSPTGSRSRVTHAAVARRIRRGKPRERSPDPGRGSRRRLRRRLLFWALRNSTCAGTALDRRSRRPARRLVRRAGAVGRGRRGEGMKED